MKVNIPWTFSAITGFFFLQRRDDLLIRKYVTRKRACYLVQGNFWASLSELLYSKQWTYTPTPPHTLQRPPLPKNALDIWSVIPVNSITRDMWRKQERENGLTQTEGYAGHAYQSFQQKRKVIDNVTPENCLLKQKTEGKVFFYFL